MADQRLARARGSLPEHYQYGDAALRGGFPVPLPRYPWRPWRRPSENAAKQLAAHADGIAIRFVKQYDIAADTTLTRINPSLPESWNDIDRHEH